MSKVNRKFPGPIEGVLRAADKIQAAAKSDEHGPAVLARMAPTFQVDFDALITALVKAMSDQSGAKGDVHTLSVDQQKAVTEIERSVGTARAVARSTFPANKPLLHDEFTVNQERPYGIDAIIGRAKTVHAACVKYAEPLALNGWPAADTTQLAALIATLEGANTDRSGAGGTQKGSTVGVTNLANALHTWIRRVQIAANRVYPAEDAISDATIVESRSRYLLGVYPPKKAAPATPPADPTAPAAGGTTTPGSTTAASGGTA